MHFDVLLLLWEVNENPSQDMLQVVGGRKSTLSNFVTMAP